jgi:hypothetical protein
MCELYKFISKFCNVRGNDGLTFMPYYLLLFQNIFQPRIGKIKMTYFIKNQKNEK